ncbi:MAG: hypothetical protein U0Y68_14970 [Blastocatellia bacterium]
MDASAIFITASAAAAFGVGTGLSLKLIPAFFQARRVWKTISKIPLIHPSSPKTSATRQRDTSIIGLYEDALRHAYFYENEWRILLMANQQFCDGEHRAERDALT